MALLWINSSRAFLSFVFKIKLPFRGKSELYFLQDMHICIFLISLSFLYVVLNAQNWADKIRKKKNFTYLELVSNGNR